MKLKDPSLALPRSCSLAVEGKRGPRLLHFSPDVFQTLFGQCVVGRELQGLFEVMAGLDVHLLGRKDPAQVVMGIVIRLIAPRVQGALEPGQRFIVFAFSIR